jgi:hypothetical protein
MKQLSEKKYKALKARFKSGGEYLNVTIKAIHVSELMEINLKEKPFYLIRFKGDVIFHIKLDEEIIAIQFFLNQLKPRKNGGYSCNAKINYRFIKPKIFYDAYAEIFTFMQETTFYPNHQLFDLGDHYEAPTFNKRWSTAYQTGLLFRLNFNDENLKMKNSMAINFNNSTIGEVGEIRFEDLEILDSKWFTMLGVNGVIQG